MLGVDGYQWLRWLYPRFEYCWIVFLSRKFVTRIHARHCIPPDCIQLFVTMVCIYTHVRMFVCMYICMYVLNCCCECSILGHVLNFLVVVLLQVSIEDSLVTFQVFKRPHVDYFLSTVSCMNCPA